MLKRRKKEKKQVQNFDREINSELKIFGVDETY